MRKASASAAGVALACAAWEAASVLKNDPAIVPIERIAKALVVVVSDAGLPKNLFATVKILVIGVAIATAFGVAGSVLVSLDWRVESAVMPIIGFLRNIPSITLFPILLVMYGIGDSSRIFVIFWTAFPPIIMSAVHGIASVDRGVVEAGHALGMTNFQVMRLVKVPLAMPTIVNGVRIGTGSGFVAIVVAEMLGATSGIGYMVLWTTNSFRYPETYVYIIIIGAIGFTVNYAMESFEERLKRKVSK